MNFPGLADPYPPKPQQTGGCLLRIASHASHSDGDGNCHALLEVMQWEGGACVILWHHKVTNPANPSQNNPNFGQILWNYLLPYFSAIAGIMFRCIYVILCISCNKFANTGAMQFVKPCLYSDDTGDTKFAWTSAWSGWQNLDCLALETKHTLRADSSGCWCRPFKLDCELPCMQCANMCGSSIYVYWCLQLGGSLDWRHVILLLL